MSNTVVVDTSIVIKWVFREKDSDQAYALLEEWIDKQTVILAPGLLAYELTNVLYRKARKQEIAYTDIAPNLIKIFGTGLELDSPVEISLSIRAAELAHQFGLPAAYDTHFLALAEREGCELWTADTRMWRAIGGQLAWVQSLDDYQPR